MFANLLGRLGQLFAQPATQAIAAGLLTGTIGASVLLASGVFSSGATASQTVALLACPGSGPVLARIAHGQQTLVTARSANGEWLEVYLGEPGVQRAWAPAQALRLQTGVDRLPVHDCSAPGHSAAPTVIPTLGPPPTVAPTVVPSPAGTLAPTGTPAAAASPTPRPTRTLKPTPAPTADTFAPTLTNFGPVSPGPYINGSYYIYSNHNCGVATATIHVTATDPSGVASVTIYVRPPLGSTFSVAMTAKGGGVWEYVVAPTGSWSQGEIGLWVSASDSFGNASAQLPFHDPNSNTDVSLYWDPFCIG